MSIGDTPAAPNQSRKRIYANLFRLGKAMDPGLLPQTIRDGLARLEHMRKGLFRLNDPT
jgi:hypothetical protein